MSAALQRHPLRLRLRCATADPPPPHAARAGEENAPAQWTNVLRLAAAAAAGAGAGAAGAAAHRLGLGRSWCELVAGFVEARALARGGDGLCVFDSFLTRERIVGD